MAITRATFLRHAVALAAGAAARRVPAGDMAVRARMLTRPIPATGEALPIVGCGTWQTFDVGDAAGERAPLAATLQTLFDAGGRVIDSSPMYARAEGVVGALLADASTHPQAFLATKVWTRGRAAGIAQMEASQRLLRTPRIDLMQIHNLVDWRTHLPTLREWKAAGRIRYVGITHYTAGAYADVEAALRAERFDFVQINYALDDRTAEDRILPLAADRGVAVLVNRPFGSGGLLRKVQGEALPDWARDLDCTSWAQLFLKFVLAHPAVTCAIPATRNPAHMADNAAAGSGRMPDAAQRAQIAQRWDAR